MVDFILEKFTSIATNCLQKNAKELGVDKTNVELTLRFGRGGEVEYLLMKEYAPTKVLTFLQVLGVKLDFKGYSLFVPKFIKGALNRFCDKHTIAKDKVAVMMFLTIKNELMLFLYDGTKPIEIVELESLFDSEDMINMEQ